MKMILLALVIVVAGSLASGVIKDEAIDISHWQGVIDFDSVVKNGIRTVVHKATQGIKYIDPLYVKNQASAKRAGLQHWGAYHFADSSDGILQAKHFLDVAKRADFYAVDLEQNGKSTVGRKQAEDIVRTISQETGRDPLIYGGADFLNTFNESNILAKCPLWVASWRSGEPTMPRMWKNWVFWQHTDGTHGSPPFEVPGIGKCDRDKVNEQTFLQFLKDNRETTLE